MSTQSPLSFLSEYLDSNTCELFANESGEIIAYVPQRENYSAMIGLRVTSYVDAEIKARAMGLEPNWK